MSNQPKWTSRDSNNLGSERRVCSDYYEPQLKPQWNHLHRISRWPCGWRAVPLTTKKAGPSAVCGLSYVKRASRRALLKVIAYVLMPQFLPPESWWGGLRLNTVINCGNVVSLFFPPVIQKCSKFANFTRLYFPLQHFAPKLHNFTKLRLCVFQLRLFS